MVSLLSLFGGKKKPKKAGASGPSSSAASSASTGRRRSRSPPPTQASAASAVTPRPVLTTHKSGSSSSGNKLNAFASSAGNNGTAKFLSLRSKSSGGVSLLSKGRSKAIAGDASPTKETPAWELPSFGFGDKGDDLGLSNVGGLPKITEQEWQVVQDVRFGMTEINAAWRLIGEGLRIAPDPLIVLSPTLSSSDSYRALLTLLILSIRPPKLSSLPSIASHYPSIGAAIPATWQSRFLDVLYTCTPSEQAQAAKWTLCRLENVGPIIDIAYRQFALAERKAGYPADAYTSYKTALAQADLSDMFAVWADLAARAPVESLLGGKLALLWAWWLVHATDKVLTWDALYRDWEASGKRMQHLFYAWIRQQSVTQTLSFPTRLAQLIAGYPYGSTDMPAIPTSSFTRPVLHLELMTEQPLDHVRYEMLMQSAFAAQSAEDGFTPLRDALGHQGDIDTLMDNHSSDDPPREPFRSTHSPTPSVSTLKLGNLAQTVGEMADNHSTIRARGATLGRNVSRPSQAASHSAGQATRALPVDWDDFTKSGFAEDDSALNLSLSPSSSRAPQLPPIDVEASPRPTCSSKPDTIPAIVNQESIVHVDDVFFAFVRDARADGGVNRKWAPFSLVKLRTPFRRNSSTIEGVLVTISYRAPKAPSIVEEPVTPELPVQDDPKRFSTFGFRRQSMPGKRMKGLFGSTRSIPRLDEQIRQDEAKAARGRLGSVTEDPRVLSEADVDEMGMMRSNVPATITPSPASARAQPVVAPIVLGAPVRNGGDIVLESTQVSDWHYVAEGGAHAVFGYHGANSEYHGKMLRLRKAITGTDHPKDDVMQVWSKELLPTLVPADLLVETVPARLTDGEWLRALLDEAEQHRPQHRVEKGESNTLAQDIGKPVKAWLMEDLRKADHGPGESAMSVEIKPKWGFLPDAAHVNPPEAAAIKSTIGRFTLHQHYRGKSTTRYDPLDLYSDDETRMQNALDGLLHDWVETGGKANNLRIFVDGKAVLPPADTTLNEKIRAAVIPALRQSGAMHLLRQLQSTLDSTDISAVAQLFSAEHPGSAVFDPAAPVLAGPTPEELRAFLRSYKQNHAPTATRTLREQIVSYAMSAIFKDGSIMIRSVISATGSAESTVKLLDLDLKPLKMQAWYELDEKLWRHWQSTHPGKADEVAQVNAPGPAPAVDAIRVVAQASTAGTAPISPTTHKKPKFAGKLNLGTIPAPASTPANVGDRDFEPAAAGDEQITSLPLAQSVFIPATPAVEMTLEDVLSLSPAKLKAKPGQKIAIAEVEEQAEVSTEAVNGHAVVIATEQDHRQGIESQLEELVIDQPADEDERTARSWAPSPSFGPDAALGTPAISNGIGIGNGATAAVGDEAEMGQVYAAPATPTFGTAAELPATSPEKEASRLSLSPTSPSGYGSDSDFAHSNGHSVLQAFDDEKKEKNLPPTHPAGGAASADAELATRTAQSLPGLSDNGERQQGADESRQFDAPLVPDVNHDVVHAANGGTEVAPDASVGAKGVAEARLEQVAHDALDGDGKKVGPVGNGEKVKVEGY